MLELFLQIYGKKLEYSDDEGGRGGSNCNHVGKAWTIFFFLSSLFLAKQAAADLYQCFFLCMRVCVLVILEYRFFFFFVGH